MSAREGQPRPTLGDNVFEQVGTFHTLPDGTIVPDAPKADDSTEDER
ncbi:hypothetical protein JOD62_001697 [Microbacterium keratanolyticum]|uniref:Uncharacterized protein n=1 Tax=Microbacterium keratanolyticum TaxID=67574 RepID=A0A9W6HSG5_9MICO|nr:hypothetical protein [Microbacterium keratanolyticum]MBM7469149.1 hypothetical protein [Microbacterium keratanolyticum]GLK01230.1 hypothetical protein GCM10017596_09450 [Microbacterium keratanolyticum]